MKYKIIGQSNYLEVKDWVIQLANPLVFVESQLHCRSCTYPPLLVANGIGETMLVLKFSHVIECVTQYKLINKEHMLEVWEWIESLDYTLITVTAVYHNGFMITTTIPAEQVLLEKFGTLLEKVL